MSTQQKTGQLVIQHKQSSSTLFQEFTPNWWQHNLHCGTQTRT